MNDQLQAIPGAGLDAFFKARSVAVVGASDDITKIGGRPIQLMLKYGYAGSIYPINPKGGVIQGLQAYASILDTPTAPELAILAVPMQATAQAVRDCGSRGVRDANWDEAANIRIEVICTRELAEALLAHLQKHYYANYAMVSCLHEVEVVRAEKF